MPPKAKLDVCHYARSWTVTGCSWSNEVENIAKIALPPPPLNTLESRRESTSPSSGDALTIGQALAMEQEPSHPPFLRRSTQAGKMSTWDVSEPSLSMSLESRERDREQPAWESDYDDGDSDSAAAAGPHVSLDIEVLRPVLKALRHCLMAPSSTSVLKSVALDAANALCARSFQSLLPEAMLASRSLIPLSAASSLGLFPPSTKVHRAEILIRQAKHEN